MSGQEKSGQVRSGLVRSGDVKLGHVSAWQVRSGKMVSGQVREGKVSSGKVLTRPSALDHWSCLNYCFFSKISPPQILLTLPNIYWPRVYLSKLKYA